MVLEHKHHLAQDLRGLLGVVRLRKGCSPKRLEAACDRALELGAGTYASVKSVLDGRLDQRPKSKAAADGTAINHPRPPAPRRQMAHVIGDPPSPTTCLVASRPTLTA
jgi:hypothetical protein